MSALFISARLAFSMMIEVSVSKERDFSGSSITHWVTRRKFEVSHCSLFTEPLLAGPAVLDVLQHVTQHGPLSPLILPHALRPLVHPGT